MKYVDVIGIGAINYDYMFTCKKSDNKNKIADDGEENLGCCDIEIEEEISELYKTCKHYSTQIGGSSLLTLKTINAIDKSLSIGFVGVCGQISEFDKRYGKNLNVKNELSFIDNQEWLFYPDMDAPISQRYIAKAVIKLHKNTRDHINISQSANDLIINYIKKKEQNTGRSIVDYLSQAKWIHITSLNLFEHFEEIMKYVIKAKENNRFLKMSMDLGYQYTKEKSVELKKYLKYADYIFLNQSEYNNLIKNTDLPDDDKYIKLSTYFENIKNINTKIFIIKHKSHHELIDMRNGVPYIYYHKSLPFYKIYNDTGAGDCFAGGFIAATLSDKLIAQQPASVSLGVLAAKTRMKTMENSFVYDEIKNESKKFVLKKYINGKHNRYQRICLFMKSHTDFIIGFVTSFIITFICSLII